MGGVPLAAGRVLAPVLLLQNSPRRSLVHRPFRNLPSLNSNAITTRSLIASHGRALDQGLPLPPGLPVKSVDGDMRPRGSLAGGDPFGPTRPREFRCRYRSVWYLLSW